MLQPISITLNNFKCFKDAITFEYPSEAGLYFVTGLNNINPELEANACGKSTLFGDAPCWCLYGKTPRGVKAGDVVNWESSRSSVAFTFTCRGTLMSIIRNQHPNSLLMSINNGPALPCTQDDIDKHLGLDYSAFCNSVIFGQLTTTFFDLTPAAKSEVLESVLPLEVWEVASKSAKTLCESFERNIELKLQDIASLKGKYQALSELDLVARIEEWEALRQQEILEVEQAITEDDLQLKRHKKQGVTLQQTFNKVTEQIAQVDEVLVEAEAEYEGIYKENVQIEWQITSKVTELEQLKKELERFKRLGGICSNCKQIIDEKHVEKEENKLKERMDVIIEALAVAKKHRITIHTRLNTVGADIGEVKNEKLNVQQQLNDVNRRLSELKYVTARLFDDIKKKKERILVLNQRENPFIAQKSKIDDEKRRIRNECVQLKSQLSTLESDKNCAHYWIQGFKEVKLLLINDILTQLELEVNNYLYQFGLHDWKVEFAVDSTTKAGKLRKGFTVTIKPPHTQEPVAWASWSGGETQRLRLAGALGMSDLILACFGLSPGLEVHDEPSTYLSAKGISDLIEVLRDRAIDTGRKIFLIDHRNLDTLQFNGVYTVVRDENAVKVLTD